MMKKLLIPLLLSLSFALQGCSSSDSDYDAGEVPQGLRGFLVGLFVSYYCGVRYIVLQLFDRCLYNVLLLILGFHIPLFYSPSCLTFLVFRGL